MSSDSSSNSVLRPPRVIEERVIEEGHASNHQAAQSQQPRALSHPKIRNDVYAAFFELIGTVGSSPALLPVAGIDKQVDPRQLLLCSP